MTWTFSSYSQRLLRAPCMVELPSAVLALEVSVSPSKVLVGQQQLGFQEKKAQGPELGMCRLARWSESSTVLSAYARKEI